MGDIVTNDQISAEKDDIEKVKNLQEDYLKTTAQVGQLTVELHVLKSRTSQLEEALNSALKHYEELQISEQDLVDELNQKYGDGVLDLNSGTFNKET